MPTVKVIGGKRYKRFFRQVRTAQLLATKSVEVGFFESARYPPLSTGLRGGRKQGTVRVAWVAAMMELGTVNSPERPYFRQALESAKPKVKEILKSKVQAKNLVVNRQLAGKIGALVQGEIQKSIVQLEDPPNAPSTIKRKQLKSGGKTTPLIDTGKLRTSVTWQVHK